MSSWSNGIGSPETTALQICVDVRLPGVRTDHQDESGARQRGRVRSEQAELAVHFTHDVKRVDRVRHHHTIPALGQVTEAVLDLGQIAGIVPDEVAARSRLPHDPAVRRVWLTDQQLFGAMRRTATDESAGLTPIIRDHLPERSTLSRQQRLDGHGVHGNVAAGRR